jgi:class 3 adenylate cyclase
VPVCERCGRENPDEARFCNGCGAALLLEPAAAEELKIVTVLFADITGSTALGERLDAEGLKQVMGTFFAAMREEIEAEGGTVEKFIGDAVMAAFGVPRVHDDDPARALRAALRMRSRLRDVNAMLQERFGVALELRMGINTGHVMAVIDSRPGEALATGDAVNAAARLEQAAAPGEVLVSERTARAARHFHFGPVRELPVRGKAEPLHALALLTEQPITEGTLSATRAPFVGRDRELELLTALHGRAVAEGRPHLVTVYGEAGVGKSRLVGELLAAIETGAPEHRVVRGRCLSYGDGISYWPLAEIVKAYAQVLDTDSADVARARVTEAAAAALTDAGAGEPAELAGVLAASVALGEADPSRGAQELRAETQLAWRAFFTALASAAPTVVLIEDIQWADAAVLDLLDDVAGHTAGPLFVLCTARPELTARRPTWGGGRRSFTGIAVEPLDERESGRLATLLLGEDAGERERAAVVTRAEGNPFFLEEIVRRRDFDTTTLPDTVQSALAARVDLLPPDEKRALQTAAVVGRVFWPGAVADVAGADPGTVSEVLDRLQNRDLVLSRLSSSMSGQRELIFKHALVHEVAYASLPRRDRVRMHRGVADWIERTFAGREAEVVELIAHHRAAAYRLGPSDELRGPAFEALADAAESAYARAGFERARSLAREALEPAGTPLERARALEALGRASFAILDGSTAWASLREAADIVREHAPHDRDRFAFLCGLVTMIPARAQGSMREQPSEETVAPYLELGLACAGDRDSEALVLLLASKAYWEFGFDIDPANDRRDESEAAARRAREVARRLGRRDLELMTLDALTSVLIIRGLYGLAEPADLERLEIARTIRDPFEVGDSFYTAAWTKLDIGRYRDVVALGAEYQSLEIAAPMVGHLADSAVALLPMGDWDGALADQARLRALLDARGAGPASFASGGYGAEALIHQARAEPDAADAVIAEVESWKASGGAVRRWPLAGIAVALARRGDFAGARRRLAQFTNDVYRPRGLEVHCTLIAEEATWDEAPGVIADARALAEAGRLLALPLHADRLEGRARLAGGDAEGAVEPLERALAGFQDLSAGWAVALTELSLGEAYAELGRGDDAARVLAHAAAVFERLRVPRELERARALGLHALP